MLHMDYNNTAPMTFRGKTQDVMWYYTGEPEARFGYGWYAEREEKQDYYTPAAFYFNAVQGWVQQSFFDWRPDLVGAPSNVFDVPEACLNAPSCGFF